MSGGGAAIAHEKSVSQEVNMEFAQERPMAEARIENLVHIEDSDIMMFGYINGADSVDMSAVDLLAGDGEVHDDIDKMSDSDDPSSEESPGPAAWVAFQYVPVYKRFSYFVSTFYFY